jgi:hypothetical protein
MIFPSPCSFSLLLKEPFEKRAIKGEKSKGERERDTVFQRKKERKKEQKLSSQAQNRSTNNVSLFFSPISVSLLQKLLFFFF